MACRHCGAEILGTPESGECPKCRMKMGSSESQPRLTCTCGERHLPGAKFCKKCGNSVGAVIGVAATTPEPLPEASQVRRQSAISVLPSPSRTLPPPIENRSTRLILCLGGGLALVLLVIIWVVTRISATPTELGALRQQLDDLQRKQALQEQARLDQSAQQEAKRANELRIQDQLSPVTSAAEKETVQRQLEESKLQKVELERQAKELADRQKQLQAAQQAAAARAQAVVEPTRQAPPSVSPPVRTNIPAPQQTQNVPAPAASNPAPLVPQAESKPVAQAVEVPAMLVNLVAPIFPMRAMAQKWELNKGHTVRLRVFVSESGQALTVKVIEGVAGSYGFDEAAIDAAKQSSYQPATRDGKAVKAWTELSFRFPKQAQ